VEADVREHRLAALDWRVLDDEIEHARGFREVGRVAGRPPEQRRAKTATAPETHRSLSLATFAPKPMLNAATRNRTACFRCVFAATAAHSAPQVTDRLVATAQARHTPLEHARQVPIASVSG